MLSRSRLLNSIARAVVLCLAVVCLTVASSLRAENAGVLIISEIHYHPLAPAGAEEDARALEFIEVTNATPAPLDLSGWFFSRGVNFTFPEGTWLNGGQYLVVCADQERVREVYGIQNTLGNWTSCGNDGMAAGCALSNGGEAIEISEQNGVVAARVRYDDRGKWPAAADGTGHTLSLAKVHSEPDDPDSWTASAVLGGSPGVENPLGDPLPAVLFNEALLWVEGDGERWVELYNPSSQDVDIGGLWITDERANLTKFSIPPGTMLPALGFLSFSEAELGLDLSPVAAVEGELGRRFLALSTAGADRVIDARIFRPEELGSSEARIPDGDEDWADRATPSRSNPNVIDVETDIVINEVLYHPIHGAIGEDESIYEFVELYNRSTTRTIDLSDWRFTSGINYTFPEGVSLAPEGYLVVAKSPATIIENYGLPAAQVLGPDPANAEAVDGFGRLRDDGERINLRDSRGRLADTVRYHDGGQWPLWADGGGSSMELIDAHQNNNVAGAWDSSDDSAKSEPQFFEYMGTYNSGEPEFHIYSNHRGVSIIDDLRMVQRVITFESQISYIENGDTWRIFRGQREPSEPRDAWYQPEFDDSVANGWFTGPTPIGYGEDDEGTDMNSEELPQEDRMRGHFFAFFLRKEFTVSDLSALDDLALRLHVEYDDGYIAYLNGTRIVVENMRTNDEFPGGFEDTIDSRARASRERFGHETDISEFKNLLVEGRNVLALQVHNSSIGSSDVRAIPTLAAGLFVPADSDNFVDNGDFEEELNNRRVSALARPSGGAGAGEWKIEGTHVNSARTTHPDEVISGAGAFKLIAKGKGDYKVNRCEQTIGGGLSPRSVYNISFMGRWIVGSETLITRGYNHNYPKSHRFDVPLNLGTPGAINSVTLRQMDRTGSPSIGPVIDKFSQTPAVPRADEEVLISVRVSDPEGVGDVSLYYSINDPLLIGDPELTELPMTGPDHRDRWTATIPGQERGNKVVFFIVASDTGGATGRYPIDPLERTHPLVLDEDSAVAIDRSYLVYRHDNPAPTNNNPSYRFWLHSAAETYLNNNRKLSNDRVEGSFIFGNEDMYHTSRVRFSGSPWARQKWTESYRVTMPKDDPLHGTIKRFGLEDHQAGGARNARERISNYLIRHNQGSVKAPYSFQWLVQWEVSRGRSSAINEVREHVQVPNVELIQRWYPNDDDGDFFEMDDRFTISDAGERQGNTDGRLTFPPYAAPGLERDSPENYRYWFSTRLHESKDDFSRLVDFSRVLDMRETPNAAFDELIWDTMNVEAFLRVLSIRLNTGDWDTWGYNRGKNCYVYRPFEDGRWVLLPWDMELSYEGGHQSTYLIPSTINQNYITNNGLFPELNRFWNRPRVKRMLYGILWDMVNHQFNSGYLAPLVSRLQARGMNTLEIARPNGFVHRRSQALTQRLRNSSSLGVDFEITSNSGADFETDANRVLIEGQAPIEIWSLVALVNGAQIDGAAQFSNDAPLAWSANLPLGMGANDIQVIGFGSAGDLVASDNITVTTSAEGSPLIARIEPSVASPGETVSLFGSNLTLDSEVLFGEVPATELDRTGLPERLDVIVPAGLAAGEVAVRVRNPGPIDSNAVTLTIEIEPTALFVRGDTDRNGRLSINDAVDTLVHLFQQGTIDCEDAADFDDDGSVTLTDAVATFNVLFRRGPAPSAPYPQAGTDPTADELGCELGL